METTVKKNQTASVGKYSYQYVDIAQIHEYLEQNNMSYYQFIDRIDGDDYIMTVKVINGEEQAPLRGARVVDATLIGVNNPAQQQGSALTYARRYSLLMAFGLATEDDDAQSLSTEKIVNVSKEDAENYELTFGKYKGKKLNEVPNDYIEWLIVNSKDPMVIKCCEVLLDASRQDYITDDEKTNLIGEIMDLIDKTGTDPEALREHYKKNSFNAMTKTELENAKAILEKKVK